MNGEIKRIRAVKCKNHSLWRFRLDKSRDGCPSLPDQPRDFVSFSISATANASAQTLLEIVCRLVHQFRLRPTRGSIVEVDSSTLGHRCITLVSQRRVHSRRENL